MEESIGLAVGATAEVTPYLTAWDYLFTLLILSVPFVALVFIAKKYLLPRFGKQRSYLNMNDWNEIKREIEGGNKMGKAGEVSPARNGSDVDNVPTIRQ